MKHKTADIEGALLDQAVAKAEGWTKSPDDRHAWSAPEGSPWGPVASIERGGIKGGYGYHPAHNSAHSGPIIERERLVLVYADGWTEGPGWHAFDHKHFEHVHTAELASGPTLLIAAMRAYVASAFGDEVELP